jgi:hypothetical protein
VSKPRKQLSAKYQNISSPHRVKTQKQLSAKQPPWKLEIIIK